MSNDATNGYAEVNGLNICTERSHCRHEARDIDTSSRGPDDRGDRRTPSGGAASGAASRLSASRTGGRR
jgi:hypothetical protein